MALRPAMPVNGMNGIPAVPLSRVPTEEKLLGRFAATALVAGAVIQECGTDNAPTVMPRPIGALSAAPLPVIPSETDPSDCAPDSTALTAPVAAAVSEPVAALVNPIPLSRKFSAYMAKFSGTASELSFESDVDNDVKALFRDVMMGAVTSPARVPGSVVIT